MLLVICASVLEYELTDSTWEPATPATMRFDTRTAHLGVPLFGDGAARLQPALPVQVSHLTRKVDYAFQACWITGLVDTG